MRRMWGQLQTAKMDREHTLGHRNQGAKLLREIHKSHNPPVVLAQMACGVSLEW